MEEYLKSTKHIVNSFKPPLVPMTSQTAQRYRPKPKPNPIFTHVKDEHCGIFPGHIYMPYYGADGQILTFY